MSYCPKCGRQILEESLGCPVCSIKEHEICQGQTSEPTIEAEVVTSFTVEDEQGGSQRFETKPAEPTAKSWESYRDNEPKAVPDQVIPTVLKVIIILAIICVGGIGSIAGIIAGVALIKSPIEDYRKFGKTLIIVSAVMIAIWFLCCVVGGFFGMIGNMGYYYDY